MGEVISFVGQKGGTGKSTLARAFAVEAARVQANILIADLDDAQRTSFEWGQRRLANGFKPTVNVERMQRRPKSVRNTRNIRRHCSPSACPRAQ